MAKKRIRAHHGRVGGAYLHEHHSRLLQCLGAALQRQGELSHGAARTRCRVAGWGRRG
jgi:hypothetical protein